MSFDKFSIYRCIYFIYSRGHFGRLLEIMTKEVWVNKNRAHKLILAWYNTKYYIWCNDSMVVYSNQTGTLVLFFLILSVIPILNK